MAGLRRGGRVNGTELPATLQAQQDETTARTGEPRIENLTVDLAETETRLAELVMARKERAELAPAGHEPDPQNRPPPTRPS